MDENDNNEMFLGARLHRLVNVFSWPLLSGQLEQCDDCHGGGSGSDAVGIGCGNTDANFTDLFVELPMQCPGDI